MWLLALVLAATPVAKGPFEGVLQYRLSTPGTNGTMVALVGAQGVRVQVSMDTNGQKSETLLVVRAEAPTVTHQWDEKTKSFLVPPVVHGTMGPPRVEALKDEVIAGFPCKHIRLVTPQLSAEYWTTAHAMNDSRRDQMVMAAQRLAPEVEAALKSVGAFGLVVKMVVAGKTATAQPVTTTLELTGAERKPVDARAFDVHATAVHR